MQNKVKLNNILIIKLLLIISFVLFIASVIIAWNSPAIGYESSIYYSTPLLFWILIAIVVIIGISITIYCVYTNNKYWSYGILLLYFNYILMSSLQLIRGYYFWDFNGDASTHVMYINQILSYGNLGNIFYPIIHIYTINILFFTNININLLVKYLPIILTPLYPPFIFILSRTLLHNKQVTIVTTLISCSFIVAYPNIFSPYFFSNIFFVVSLFILFKYVMTQDIEWALLIIIISLLLPSFHIITSMVFIIVSISILVFNIIYIHIYRIQNKRLNDNYLLILILTIIFFIIWIINSAYFGSGINNILSIIYGTDSSQMNQLGSSIAYAQNYGFNIVDIIFRLEGNVMLLALISIINFIFIIGYIKNIKFINIFYFYIAYTSIFIFICITYLSNTFIDPTRLLSYIVIFSTIFTGYFIVWLINYITQIKNLYKTYTLLSLVIVMLLFLFINSCITYYPSPYTLSSNYQTTVQDIHGYEWVLNNRNIDTPMAGIISVPTRFANSLLTINKLETQNLKFAPRIKIPYHFGYEKYKYMINNYNYNIYIINTETDISYYRDIFSEMSPIRFNSQDYNQTQYDPSVNYIYSSNEFEVWLLK